MSYPRVHGPLEYAQMTSDELRWELVRRDAAAREFLLARDLLCKQLDQLKAALSKAEKKLEQKRSKP